MYEASVLNKLTEVKTEFEIFLQYSGGKEIGTVESEVQSPKSEVGQNHFGLVD